MLRKGSSSRAKEGYSGVVMAIVLSGAGRGPMGSGRCLKGG